MDDETTRFGLPLLAAGQAQKEVLHNEALAAIDLLLHAIVEAAGIDTPPLAPAEGQAWLIGNGPTGAWAGHAGAIAAWTAAGWRFAGPVEGMRVWVRAAAVELRRGPAGWSDGGVDATALRIGGVQVVGSRRPAIAAPSGGATIDLEARATLATVLSTLQFHGLISA